MKQLRITPVFVKHKWQAIFEAAGLEDEHAKLMSSTNNPVPLNEAVRYLALYREAGVPMKDLTRAVGIIEAMQATGDPELNIRDTKKGKGKELIYSQGGVALITEPIKPGENNPSGAMGRMEVRYPGVLAGVSREVILAVREEQVGNGANISTHQGALTPPVFGRFWT